MKELQQISADEFKELMGHLSKHRTRQRKTRFGLERISRREEHISRASCRDPRLYYLLMKFARVHCPIDFTTIDVWENQPIQWKTEKAFEGESMVIGFGTFSGYEIQLKNSARPILLNFAPTILEPTDFVETQQTGTGTAFFLHFRKLANCQRTLADFDAVIYMGEWSIAWYRNGSPTVFLSKKNGLPRSSTTSKKYQSPTLGAMAGSVPTTAQNFLFSLLESNSRNAQECSLDNISTSLDANDGDADPPSDSSSSS